MTNKNTPEEISMIVQAARLESLKIALGGGRRKYGLTYDDANYLAGYVVGKRFEQTGSFFEKDEAPTQKAKEGEASPSSCGRCSGKFDGKLCEKCSEEVAKINAESVAQAEMSIACGDSKGF